MQLVTLDPRALSENPDHGRRTKSSPQADALLLATIKAVGIVQPPIVVQSGEPSNGYVISAGHRRVRQAIAAGLEEIEVLVADAADDNGAMRSVVENIAREPLNPVDQWRAIERLVARAWTEEAIALALALPIRQVKKLRLLANLLPAMLDHMTKGDMPSEQHLRTIAAASIDEQKEIWKAHKPKKGDPQVSWWTIANALTKKRMYARNASFDEELTRAYGIEWVEDLFAPADEDSRHTTNVEAFLGAQHEWMTNHMPKGGVIAEANNWGEAILPAKAERVYGKPGKGDRAAMHLDREGKVQTIYFRTPDPRKSRGQEGGEAVDGHEALTTGPAPRPDVTQKGIDMIGDFRTDALHEALSRAPIEDDTLMALLVLALAGRNVTIASGASDDVYGFARMERHAKVLVDESGKLAFDQQGLRIAARSALIDAMSLRKNRSNSGLTAQVAGATIGADAFLANMGTEAFLTCLSRTSLEQSCRDTPVLPRQRVKDTRAALVEHFQSETFVHSAAGFVPETAAIASWLGRGDEADEDPTAGADDCAEIESIEVDDVDVGADDDHDCDRHDCEEELRRCHGRRPPSREPGGVRVRPRRVSGAG